jgi:predicted DNA-binding transcriptional regulator AlpA
MDSTAPLIGTLEIAQMLGVTRDHVCDRVVKAVGFPKPVINASQKMRRWSEYEVRKWASKRRS